MKIRTNTVFSRLTESFKASFDRPALAVYFLPVNPVPASRPIVTRYNVRYSKKYDKWRKDAEKIIGTFKLEHKIDYPICVIIECLVLKPRHTRRGFPYGDFDNFAKPLPDAITTHTNLWRDDDLIVAALVTKQFVSKGNEGTRITIYEYETL